MTSNACVVRLPNGGWVDHIVWGTPDTEAAVNSLGEQLGVTASIDTKHWASTWSYKPQR